MLTQWIIEVSERSRPTGARMTPDQAAAMFANMATFYGDHPQAQIEFIWHGGEPQAGDPDTYRRLFAEQKRRLGDRTVKNHVLTSLTVLDEDRLAWLRELEGVGVSVDLFGTHRLDLAGRASEAAVLENLERLRREPVALDCFTVLDRQTIPHVESIFRFYERTNLSFRALAPYRAAAAPQDARVQPGGQDVLDALCQLFDLWMASPTRIHIAPFMEILEQLVRRRGGDPPAVYDRRTWEELVVVNADGELYADADAGEPGRSWGNIVSTPLTTLLAGAERERSLRDTEARLASTCAGCEFFGACRGLAMAEAMRRYADDVDDTGPARCIVERGLYAHIQRRLDEVDADVRAPSMATPA